MHQASELGFPRIEWLPQFCCFCIAELNLRCMTNAFLNGFRLAKSSLEGSQAGQKTPRHMREAKVMSVGVIALIVYFLLACLAMVAMCRAASRGDRPMDDNRFQ